MRLIHWFSRAGGLALGLFLLLLSVSAPLAAQTGDGRIIVHLESTGLGNYQFDHFVEEIQVLGRDLVDRVKTLIHEGNVNRIIIKDDKGQTFVEIPVTVAAVGALAAPVLAAIGALSALVAKFKIVVERSEPKPAEQPESAQAQSKAP